MQHQSLTTPGLHWILPTAVSDPLERLVVLQDIDAEKEVMDMYAHKAKAEIEKLLSL